MNDLQIDYFMAVAANRSFTKTSEELFVSQPAISRQIALLEKELDARLFIRNNQRTELTEVGKLYYDYFSRTRLDLINTRLKASELLGRNKGLIRVGFLEGWDLFRIIPLMSEKFRADYPDSEIVINCCGIRDLTSSLLNDSIDIAVTMKNSTYNFMELESTDVADIRKILLFSGSHPLASRDDITLKDFSNDTFFAPWEIADKMIIDITASYTRPYGFVPELRFVKNHESMITCVRNNMGVAIADEWVWAKNAADICYIPIESTDVVSIVRMRSRTDEKVTAMEDILKDVIMTQEG